MDPSYQNVVDPGDIVFTFFAYTTHGVAVAAQLGVAGFLIVRGAHALFGSPIPSWLRSLGVTDAPEARRIAAGALSVALGIALLAPLGLGAPMAVSLLAAVGALTLLVGNERGLSQEARAHGRIARRAAMACAAGALAFMAWEREDNLALGVDLLRSASEWRNEELSWQLDTDPAAPKVGELAPDFELQDPAGEVRVRLSDLRGERPVALVFGSYT